jgi:hypothetical protein
MKRRGPTDDDWTAIEDLLKTQSSPAPVLAELRLTDGQRTKLSAIAAAHGYRGLIGGEKVIFQYTQTVKTITSQKRNGSYVRHVRGGAPGLGKGS